MHNNFVYVFQRRLSGTEKDANGFFGLRNTEYNKLTNKIMQETPVTNALEGLNERWKMLMFMHEDTMDMVKSRKERGLMIKRCRHRRELFATSIVYGLLALAFFILFMIITYIFCLILGN